MRNDVDRTQRGRPTDAREIVRRFLDQLDPEPIPAEMTNREAQAAVIRCIHKLRTFADGEQVEPYAQS